MTAPDNSNPTVAVVTLHNSPNYGSCLQTYATQKVLASVGSIPDHRGLLPCGCHSG